jgi:hypothetical protein
MSKILLKDDVTLLYKHIGTLITCSEKTEEEICDEAGITYTTLLKIKSGDVVNVPFEKVIGLMFSSDTEVDLGDLVPKGFTPINKEMFIKVIQTIFLKADDLYPRELKDLLLKTFAKKDPDWVNENLLTMYMSGELSTENGFVRYVNEQ